MSAQNDDVYEEDEDEDEEEEEDTNQAMCRNCGTYISAGVVVSGNPCQDCGPYCDDECLEQRNGPALSRPWSSEEDWPQDRR